jgi:hypothetical protein
MFGCDRTKAALAGQTSVRHFLDGEQAFVLQWGHDPNVRSSA